MSQTLSWLCTCLAIGLVERWRWMVLCMRCRWIHTCYGVDFPEDNPYDEDPLEVFDDCNVQENVFRFMAYIVWQQPTHWRTLGGWFYRNGDHRQSQSRDALLTDGGGRVVQVRLGGTSQVQDWSSGHRGLWKGLETQRRTLSSEIADRRRKRILQQDLSSFDETSESNPVLRSPHRSLPPEQAPNPQRANRDLVVLQPRYHEEHSICWCRHLLFESRREIVPVSSKTRPIDLLRIDEWHE